jgi:hypothetical protein
VFILKGVKVLYFDTLLQVFILNELEQFFDNHLVTKTEDSLFGVCAEMERYRAGATPVRAEIRISKSSYWAQA